MTLARLREKYRQMRALRAASGDPEREALRALAREFPGALAEIDRLPPEVLEARIEALDRLCEVPVAANAQPAWVRGWLLAHPALRGALLAKAWLGGRRTADAATRAAFAAEVPTLPYPEDARPWIARLDELACPPDGRLVDLVFRDVARALDLDGVDAVRALLMPRR